MPRIISYVRTNSPDPKKAMPQIRAIAAYCRATWISLDKSFVDLDCHGNTDPIARPGFSELDSEISPGDTVIVVTTIDRLSRNPSFLLETLQRFCDNNIDIRLACNDF